MWQLTAIYSFSSEHLFCSSDQCGHGHVWTPLCTYECMQANMHTHKISESQKRKNLNFLVLCNGNWGPRGLYGLSLLSTACFTNCILGWGRATRLLDCALGSWEPRVLLAQLCASGDLYPFRKGPFLLYARRYHMFHRWPWQEHSREISISYNILIHFLKVHKPKSNIWQLNITLAFIFYLL